MATASSVELSDAEVRQCTARSYLQLILLPTEACNLRCIYCYEDFKHRRMSRAVVGRVKRLLTRRFPELDRLTLSWFGGEPLLAPDIMRDILLHARGLLGEHPGVRYDSDVTTNGFLLSRPLFDSLLDLGVTRYHVSFDGPREWHDRRRVRVNGKGSFDRIWRNVTALVGVPREFNVVVQLHLDRENRRSLPAFVALYNEAIGQDRRFKIYLCPVKRLGSACDDSFPFLSETEADDAIDELSKHIEAAGIELLKDEGFSPICHAACSNTLVVRADGRLNKCTVALEHPTNQIGRLDESGAPEISEPKLGRWMRGLRSGQLEELTCPKRGLVE